MEMGNNAAKDFLSYIHRFERLEEEMKETRELKKDLAQEAKSKGYDIKAMNKILKERREIDKKGLDTVREEKYMEGLYKRALVEAGEPLGYENEFGESDV
jgi:uncharacterized protein (UPF0335 family)